MTDATDKPLQQQLDFDGPFKPSFNNFNGDDNAVLIEQLRSVTQDGHDMVYLSAPPGYGKTHLLYALMRYCNQIEYAVHYINAAAAGSVDVLDTWNPRSLLLLDNLDALVTCKTSEEILFHLLNRIQYSGYCVVLASRKKLSEHTFKLADLHSRLLKCTHYSLNKITDAERPDFISAYLERFGITITPPVLDYMLTRTSRQQEKLLHQLDGIIDIHTKDRKLTTVTVRKVI